MTQDNKTMSRYLEIALEIASRISTEEYKVGDKIYARSAIASQYGVSPETARRAICVLVDLDIVDSEKGSGVTIKSQGNATAFINQYAKRKTLETIKDELLASVERQHIEMENITQSLTDLIEASEHFRSMNPFMPFEVKITEKCLYLNKMVSEIQFWQHTGATILGVERNGTVVKSPGPDTAFRENDIFYFITKDDSGQRVREFLYNDVANE